MQKNAEKIAEILAKANSSPKTELVHKNEFELVIAVMLSAQTTDKKVNQVTSSLFKKYTCWNDLLGADLEQLQKDIHGVNFHKGKADRMIKAAQTITKEFNGNLPKNIDELIKIPGIARKSANVIQQELWNIAEGVVVDTHVSRVAGRLGLTKNTDPVKIEKDLMSIIPKKYWRNFSGSLVLHGRYVCTARKPKCAQCLLSSLCPSAGKV